MVAAQIIVQAGNEVRILDLGPDAVTVGRDPGNTLAMEDLHWSKWHCRIEPHRSGFRLVDLGTPSGTRVNGRRIGKRVLEHGDRIEVGGTILYYKEGSTSDGAAARPAPARGEKAAASPRKFASDPKEKIERILLRTFSEGGVDDLLELRAGVERFVEERVSAIGGRGTSRENLERLQEITKAIASELNLGKLLTLIVDSVIELTKAERGFLMLRNGNRLEIRTARNLDREVIRRPGTKISRSVAEEVAKTGQPLVSINAQTDERLSRSGSVSDLKLRSVMAVPLKLKGRVTGILYVDNRFEEGVFSRVDLPLVQAFADHAAVAVENARLVAENQSRTEELAKAKEKVEELNRVLNEKVRRQSAELNEVKQILAVRQDELTYKYSYDAIVGESQRMREVFRLLDKVTDSNVSVLVQGESGTGKELVARAIHFNGGRRAGPFISENCAAIPDNLLESELFGYVKGAFTGADRDKRGLIAEASGGTLFLDEIGDMSMEMQGKLLRALEEGAVRPLGGKDPVSVDVRVIAASNKDLKRMKEEGTFREDLYYRIAVITVLLPPLRDRREDVPMLVASFIARFCKEKGVPEKEISDEAMALLTGYEWPGNVRQLRNEIQRAIALADRIIVPEILSDEIRHTSVPRLRTDRFAEKPLKDVIREVVQVVERQVVSDVLNQTGWKKTHAARRLGVSRPTLDSKIALYGLRRS